ncbi:YebC/PmpR family DNA-binding transcriptional regulator [Paraliomyxa miuraensis]|uniref:YebC/PmpR family DNA-binding transcriptional regulator n=1 Tax=Paraliomyxa miuraensis TaxID=376150 RepID=UPI002259BF57|nr:YebC/PmpR family DNA-binding transcriptional regulator [Paraliomyxa miuraensis]MCX4245917.1 YebC/PmpR family DNA-binding transcriptional regulator [Paraliomyxa miuraensis]
MSGHSKWSTIKRKKGALDAKRGKIFTKIARDIQVAARMGGGDPAGNPALRLALNAAKAANMPKDNQDRAIKKGLGELGDAALDEVVYEGRGPQGSSFMVEVMTDNRNRTVAEIRSVFTKGGGELGSDGSAAWMFDRLGVVTIVKERIDEDALTERVLELGAEDVRDGGEEWVVLCEPTSFAAVSTGLEDLEPSSAQLQYLPKPESTLTLSGDAAVSVAKFWSKLDELDDVQNVFTNVELPDEVMEEHGP